MSILLLGCNGQLGIELQLNLSMYNQIISLGRSKANLADNTSLVNALQVHQPSVIINAAAYTGVDKAESDVDTAYQVNATAIKIIAEYAKNNSALLIHYSTDYVFDGSKPTPYVETDVTNPLNIYGASKLAGEKAILDMNIPAIIFRTSWLYSRHRHNFMNTILRLAKERDHLNVVCDQIGAPTSVNLVAQVTSLALNRYMSGKFTSGLYHLSASGETNWCDFARAIVGGALARGFGGKLKADDIHATSSENYPTPAKRPPNSRLDTTKLRDALKITLPHWTSHLELMLDEHFIAV